MEHQQASSSTQLVLPVANDAQRTRIVEIISATANGCLNELGYYPNIINDSRLEIQQLQSELDSGRKVSATLTRDNGKLFEDNRTLSINNSILTQDNDRLRKENEAKQACIESLQRGLLNAGSLGDQFQQVCTEKMHLGQENQRLLVMLRQATQELNSVCGGQQQSQRRQSIPVPHAPRPNQSHSQFIPAPVQVLQQQQAEPFVATHNVPSESDARPSQQPLSPNYHQQQNVHQQQQQQGHPQRMVHHREQASSRPQQINTQPIPYPQRLPFPPQSQQAVQHPYVQEIRRQHQKPQHQPQQHSPSRISSIAAPLKLRISTQLQNSAPVHQFPPTPPMGSHSEMPAFISSPFVQQSFPSPPFNTLRQQSSVESQRQTPVNTAPPPTPPVSHKSMSPEADRKPVIDAHGNINDGSVVSRKRSGHGKEDQQIVVKKAKVEDIEQEISPSMDDLDDPVEVGPDGLRPATNVILELLEEIDDEPDVQKVMCTPCINRHKKGNSDVPPPVPFRDPSMEELEEHFMTHHAAVVDAMRRL